MQADPLTEDNVIEIIQDNNLSDRQILNICKYIRQKWGRNIISPNIKGKLVDRKGILDQFFSRTTLDANSTLHFLSRKQNKPLSRSVTYCHDLPGLIAYKKIVEGYDDSIDVINVIGVDEGKSILKIIWNW